MFDYRSDMVNLKVTLISYSSELFVRFKEVIHLDSPHQVALIHLSTFNVIPNIDPTANSLTVGTKVIKVPTSCHEIESLSEYINERILSNNNAPAQFWKKDVVDTRTPKFKLMADPTTSKCLLFSVFDVNFDVPNSIAEKLGFERKLYPGKKSYESEHTVQLQPLNLIRVETNLVSSSYMNNKKTHSLFEFTPNIPSGYRILISKESPIYFPITLDQIDHIAVRLLDEQDRLVNFRGEQIVCTIHIRPIDNS